MTDTTLTTGTPADTTRRDEAAASSPAAAPGPAEITWLRSRRALVGAAAAFVLVGGAGGFAIGHATADSAAATSFGPGGQGGQPPGGMQQGQGPGSQQGTQQQGQSGTTGGTSSDGTASTS